MTKIIGGTVTTPDKRASRSVLYTEQTLTEEQKAQARENIGAVSESDTFDVVEGETVVGKNLLNLDAVQYATRFDDAGNITTSSAAGALITDYIKAPETGTIKFTFYDDVDARREPMLARRVMGYDESKNLIGMIASNDKTGSLTCGDGVAYVRFQFTTANVESQGMVFHSENPPDGYEPYTETVVVGGRTLKPECMPSEFDELVERVGVLDNSGGDADVTLAIEKARFDGQFNYIAYSKITGIAHRINTAEHFLYCAKQGFTALKGDIEVTADGKLIMCHDKGFNLDENGKIKDGAFDPDYTNTVFIHDMTEAECLLLQHAYNDQFVTNFETYIKICKKYGKIAYITIRDHYVDECVPEMMRVLRKYSMVKQCIVSGYPSFAPLQVVREADPNIMLAWVLTKYTALTTEHIDRAVSMGNMLISGFHFASASQDVVTQLAGSLAAIEYAHEKDVRVYECQVHSMEIADKLMEYGITGAQMMIAPSFE